MSKKTNETRHLSINQVSLSNEARRFIAKKPYEFADRNEENLVSIRSSIRASIEPMVRRVIETYGVQISHEVIEGVSCQVVKPKRPSQIIEFSTVLVVVLCREALLRT